MDDARPTPPRQGLGLALALALGAAAGFAGGRLTAQAPASPSPTDAASSPRDESPVVARVGDDVLTQAEFAERWRQLAPADRSFHGQRAREEGTGGARAHFLGELVDEMLLAREARRRGLDERVDVRAALRACGNRVLSRPLLVTEVRQGAIPEAEVAAFYSAHPEHFGAPARVQVREIVVTSGVTGPGDETADAASARAKAEALRARVLAGEDFGKVAAASSESATARYDGLVGWITDGQFGRPWEARAMQLQQGDVSEILEVPEGFLILRADVREESSIPPLDAVRDDIVEHLLADDQGALQRRYNVFLRSLRDAEAVEIHPELVGQDDPAEEGAASGTSAPSPGGSAAPGG